MRDSPPLFTAVVLAADRTGADAVAATAGVRCKAFAPVAGVPMILRVFRALESARSVDKVMLCGPPLALLPDLPELRLLIETRRVAWRANRDSPSLSALEALSDIPPDKPVLLTTADHALLRAGVVDEFLSASISSGADAAVAMVPHRAVQALFPEARRTALKLRGGAVCSCNLFALMSPRARGLVSFWRGVEQERKRPRRMVAGLLGPWGVAAYALRALSLQGALRRLSNRLQVRIKAVRMPFPEASVDVDTPLDLALAESILACAPADAAAMPRPG